MSFIRWILALPLIVGAVLFALAHPDLVHVTWNPLQPPIELPLYFVALCFLALGFVIGAFMAWLGMGKVRRERRQQKKVIKKLEKDINAANDKIMELSAQKSNEKSKVVNHPAQEGNLIEAQNDQ